MCCSLGTRDALDSDVSMVTCSRWEPGVTELWGVQHPSPCPPSPERHSTPPPSQQGCSRLPAAGGGGEARFSPRTLYVNNFAGSVDDWARMQISFLIPKEKTFLISTETKLSISSHHPELDRNEIRSDSIRSSTDIPVLSRCRLGGAAEAAAPTRCRHSR